MSNKASSIAQLALVVGASGALTCLFVANFWDWAPITERVMHPELRGRSDAGRPGRVAKVSNQNFFCQTFAHLSLGLYGVVMSGTPRIVQQHVQIAGTLRGPPGECELLGKEPFGRPRKTR